jgi:hypothetical protein
VSVDANALVEQAALQRNASNVMKPHCDQRLTNHWRARRDASQFPSKALDSLTA